MADEVWAIVLAGGTGTRYGRLKQLEELAGMRLVDHTVAAARRTCDRVALVLPPGVAWDGEPVDVLATGGDHQSASLRNALEAVPESATVLVLADPAHPLAADRIFTETVAEVRAGADGAVPVVPMLEVVQRVVEGVVVETLPKEDTWVTQSPQAFRAAALRAAHADAPRPVENSGMLAALGHRVVTVAGDPANLHVATAEDLAVVRRLAAGQTASSSVEPSPISSSVDRTSDR